MFHLSLALTARPATTTGLAAGIAAVALLLAGPAHAALIDVQFQSPGGGGSSGTTGVAYTGGAVVGGAGDSWNHIQTSSGSMAVNTSTGAVSGITFTWSTSGIYGLSPGSSTFAATSYVNLMQSFAVTHSGNPAMSLGYHGLTPGQAFSLYIYGQSDGGSPNYGSTITVNGSTQTALQTVTSSFVLGSNYLLFNGVADASGNISVSALTAPGKSEADINGMQLVTQVPEPASALLLGAGVIGLAAAQGRRRQGRQC